MRKLGSQHFYIEHLDWTFWMQSVKLIVRICTVVSTIAFVVIGILLVSSCFGSRTESSFRLIRVDFNWGNRVELHPFFQLHGVHGSAFAKDWAFHTHGFRHDSSSCVKEIHPRPAKQTSVQNVPRRCNKETADTCAPKRWAANRAKTCTRQVESLNRGS